MPINEKQKYPTNKRRYDKSYLRIHGKVCPECDGIGYEYMVDESGESSKPCLWCDGLGFIPKEKNGTT